MAEQAQKDKCTQDRVNLLKQAWDSMTKSLAHILCEGWKLVLQAVNALIDPAIVVAETTLTLEKVYIDNFVVFPLNAVEKTIAPIANLPTEMANFGFGPGCRGTDALFNTIKTTTAPLRALDRKLKSAEAFARRREQDLEDFANGLDDAKATIDAMLTVDCP